MRRKRRFWGIAILCFGAGVLFAFFLPTPLLIVIEALVIISAGWLFLTC